MEDYAIRLISRKYFKDLFAAGIEENNKSRHHHLMALLKLLCLLCELLQSLVAGQVLLCIVEFLQFKIAGNTSCSLKFHCRKK